MAVPWGDLPFTDLAIFDENVSSTESGVYAIMTKPDPQNKPNTYTVLYFGEAEDFSQRLDSQHEKIPCWQQNQKSGLYYELYIMSGSSQTQRQVIESQLISKYNPVCNQRA